MNKQGQFEKRIMALPQPDRSILIKKLIDIIGFENLKAVADEKIQSMTPEQFYDLDEMEQAETIWDGEYIAGREDEEHNILLYQIGDLYVEIYHQKEYNVIRKFNAFTIFEVLDIYTTKIIAGDNTD